MLNMLGIIAAHNIHSLLVIQESDQRCTLACSFFFKEMNSKAARGLGQKIVLKTRSIFAHPTHTKP